MYLPTYLMNTRQLSLTKLGILSSVPWMGMVAPALLMGHVAGLIYKKTENSLYARVPLAIAGFIVAASGMYFAAVTEALAGVIFWLSVSMVGIGTAQVSVWTACQDVGRPRSGALAGWVNLWATVGNVLCPALVVLFVGESSDWNRVLIAMAVSGAFGALIWLFVDFTIKESDSIIPGNEPFLAVETEFGKVGVLVCYELRFPEAARQLVLNGADICLFRWPG